MSSYLPNILRALAFLALWLSGFVACIAIVYQIDDNGAAFLSLNIWQLPIFSLLYIVFDNRIAKKKSENKRKFIPIIFFIISALCFSPFILQ